jgi:hypothetical protein
MTAQYTYCSAPTVGRKGKHLPLCCMATNRPCNVPLIEWMGSTVLALSSDTRSVCCCSACTSHTTRKHQHLLSPAAT